MLSGPHDPRSNTRYRGNQYFQRSHKKGRHSEIHYFPKTLQTAFISHGFGIETTRIMRRPSCWTGVATAILSSFYIVAAVNVAPRHCEGNIRHVHLAVGTEPETSMTVSFATFVSKFKAPLAGVLIGTSPHDLKELFLEQSPPTSYNLKQNKDTWTNFDGKYYSPHYHHVELFELQPNTMYFYKPILKASRGEFDEYNLHTLKQPTKEEMQKELKELDSEEDADDEEYVQEGRRLLDPYDGSWRDCPPVNKIRSFRTAPPAGSFPVSLAIIGDIGQFPHSEETLARLLRNRNEMDAVILAGDIAYTNYDHRRWDTFFDFLDDYPLFEHIPLQICPGNHDIDMNDVANDIFQAYEHRFRMPRVKPPQLELYDGPHGAMNMDAPPYPLPYEWGNAYYSFTYGAAKMIMISAYSSMEPDSIQYNWIVDELEAVDRSITPWVIAVIHTPIYNTFSLHQKDLQIVAARQHLEPLLVEHRVNMVFSGHIHAYMRTTTMSNETFHPQGPMHVTVGAGGRNCEAPFKNDEPEPWLEVRDATIYGYGMLRIHNATVAEWDWIHTGHNEERGYNELKGSDVRLEAGPGFDQVFLENQYFAKDEL